MLEPENKVFRQLDSGKALALEQRMQAFSELGLLEAETIPVFEAATQTAADFLEVPICILGFVDQSYHWFKSAVGLSRLGLMNKLAQERQLPCEESFCTHVVESNHIVVINDTLSDQAFAKSLLVQNYGIRAYLGVPLVDASGHCLGSIAVMDLEPRTFASGDIKFLEIVARWSMSEFERNRLLQDRKVVNKGGLQPPLPIPTGWGAPLPLLPTNWESHALSYSPDELSAIQVKLELLAQLTQELRTPLTSVLGMAGVVSREIYGPLTSKQKEYLEIIQDSGRYLLSMVNEISELGALNNSTHGLNLTCMDIEMICQQVINSLEETANQRQQLMRLSLEPGRSRAWLLDKGKVRQLLHHLLFSVIQAATTGSTIRIHVSYQDCGLNLTISVSHPWLGDGLTQVDPYFCQPQAPVGLTKAPHLLSPPSELESQSEMVLPVTGSQPSDSSPASASNLAADSETAAQPPNSFNSSRESLRLLLSCHLAQLHGGQVSIQGTPETGYRYVVYIAELAAVDESF